VNGQDPYAYAKGKEPVAGHHAHSNGSGAGSRRAAAVIERQKAGATMLLQTFPKQKIYVALNLLPNYQA